MICSSQLWYNSATALEARGILKPERCKEHQLFFPARRFKKIKSTGTHTGTSKKPWKYYAKEGYTGDAVSPRTGEELPSGIKVHPQYERWTSTGDHINRTGTQDWTTKKVRKYDAKERYTGDAAGPRTGAEPLSRIVVRLRVSAGPPPVIPQTTIVLTTVFAGKKTSNGFAA